MAVPEQALQIGAPSEQQARARQLPTHEMFNQLNLGLAVTPILSFTRDEILCWSTSEVILEQDVCITTT